MAREGKAPAFQFYAADWLVDEAVGAMSLAARGAYVDLMALCWREGSVPDNAALCARLIRCEAKELRRVWDAVRPRFAPLVSGDDRRLFSVRMEEQRGDLDQYVSSAGNGGRAAAANMTPEQRIERARKAAIARRNRKHVDAYEQAEGKQSDACGLLSAANTASASASAKDPPLSPASGGSAVLALSPPVPAKSTRKARRLTARALQKADAERVLDALNAARRRVIDGARTLKPTDENLALISDRLASGNTLDDCLHVIAVREAEASTNSDAEGWFTAITPFRPEPFAHALAQPAPTRPHTWTPEEIAAAEERDRRRATEEVAAREKLHA